MILTYARTALVALAITIMTASLSACTAATAQHALARPSAAHARSAATIAPSSLLPGAYLGLMAGPWVGPMIRPRVFAIGADWSIFGLKWSQWTQSDAYGHGHYIESARAACPCTRYWAAVTLTQVRSHNGKLYFAVMEVTGKRRKALRFVIDTSHGWWKEK